VPQVHSKSPVQYVFSEQTRAIQWNSTLIKKKNTWIPEDNADKTMSATCEEPEKSNNQQRNTASYIPLVTLTSSAKELERKSVRQYIRYQWSSPEQNNMCSCINSQEWTSECVTKHVDYLWDTPDESSYSCKMSPSLINWLRSTA